MSMVFRNRNICRRANGVNLLKQQISKIAILNYYYQKVNVRWFWQRLGIMFQYRLLLLFQIAWNIERVRRSSLLAINEINCLSVFGIRYSVAMVLLSNFHEDYYYYYSKCSNFEMCYVLCATLGFWPQTVFLFFFFFFK